MLKIKEIKNWNKGLVNLIEPQSIPVGSFSNALNMLTKGDKFELRRGYRVLGTDNGIGSIGGLGVASNLDSSGTQVMFRKRKGQRKFEYYDETTDDWVETGSNSAPADSNNDDFAFDIFQSIAGSQAYWSSKNSSIYKIMVANPASITDLLSTTYRGYIRIKQNRMFLWNRFAVAGGKDEQNPYLSYIDARAYTTVSAESIGTGAGTTFSDTLAFKAGGSKRTCFGIKVYDQDNLETFIDNRDGTLSSSLGGTGTINYTTGEISVTFATTIGAGKDIRCDYQWEDVTSTGIADFSFSSPTRTAGQGNVFLQGDGGPLMGIESYGDGEYCAHKYKTYRLVNGRDDTTAENLVFRDKEGIPNWRAIKGTSLGIFYVNALDTNSPKIKLMTLESGDTEVDGKTISVNLDLSDYVFDLCEINEWFDYVIFSCRTSDSSYNNRYILYNKTWKTFDIVDLWGLVSTVYNGALCIGESISQNVIEAFSGVDDNGSVIDGFAELNEWDLDYPGYLKTVKKIQVEGEIGVDQRFGVYASVDKGSYVKIGQISGGSSYVDRGQAVNVGSYTLGRGEVAGGSSNDGIVAYHYFAQFSFRVGKFERVKIKFIRENDDDDESLEGIGYFSVSTLRFYDIRLKNKKLPSKYR